MKLTAEIAVFFYDGGGIMLHDESGKVRFQLMLRGNTANLTKRENDQITEQLAAMIHRHGIEVFE